MTVQMITAQIEEIEAQAEDLLGETFGSASPDLPVDVNSVASKLGITIKQGSFDDPNIAGYFNRDERTIYVAENDPPSRQAFTVGHELGHFVRHSATDVDTFYRAAELNLGDARSNEQEANWFAASLLMPRQLIELYWPAVRDVSRMAGAFGVSASAMVYRLKNLGLIRD